MNWIRSFVLLAPMFVVACGSAERPGAEATPAAPVDVTLAPVAVQPLSRSFEAGGVIRARATASIVSPIVAEVREVRVQAGERVRRGEPLVLLDDRDLAAAGAADAAVDAGRAASEAATVTSSFAVLEAPFDGVITETFIEAGNLVAPGMPLATLEDTAVFRLEVRIDQSRLQGVTPGRVVEVALDDPDGTTDRATSVAGRVAEVARALDASAYSALVKIDLPPDPDLRSGMFGRARFTEPVRPGLALPAASVVRQGQLTLVYVVDADGRARTRPVRLGPATPDGVEVLAGLEAGERVIVAPPASVADGTSVRAGEGR